MFWSLPECFIGLKDHLESCKEQSRGVCLCALCRTPESKDWRFYCGDKVTLLHPISVQHRDLWRCKRQINVGAGWSEWAAVTLINLYGLNIFEGHHIILPPSRALSLWTPVTRDLPITHWNCKEGFPMSSSRPDLYLRVLRLISMLSFYLYTFWIL